MCFFTHILLLQILTNTPMVHLCAYILDGKYIDPKLNILTFWLIVKLFSIIRIMRRTAAESDIVGGSMQFKFSLFVNNHK